MRDHRRKLSPPSHAFSPQFFHRADARSKRRTPCEGSLLITAKFFPSPEAMALSVRRSLRRHGAAKTVRVFPGFAQTGKGISTSAVCGNRNRPRKYGTNSQRSPPPWGAKKIQSPDRQGGQARGLKSSYGPRARFPLFRLCPRHSQQAGNAR